MILPSGMTRVVLVPRTGTRINCLVARSLWLRTRGLLGRPRLPVRMGLLIERCSSVHTVGMMYPIDVVFLTLDFRVLRVVPSMRPTRATWCPHACYTLEMGGGEAEAAGVRAGELLRPLTVVHHAHGVTRAAQPLHGPREGLAA